MIILQTYSGQKKSKGFRVHRRNESQFPRLLIALSLILGVCPVRILADDSLKTKNYRASASEVMQYIQRVFFLPEEGLYAHSRTERQPDFMWGNGIMFTALL